MHIAVALRNHLLADAGVSALVGTRVYPVNLPQGPTMPAITYQRISGARIESHDGSDGLAHPVYQIDCWSDRYLEALDVAEAVRKALQKVFNTMMGGVGGVEVDAVGLENDQDAYDPATGWYHPQLDFEIWHHEERPA